MLYIIGVAHRAQSVRPGEQKTEAQQYFTSRLDQIIREVKPIFIAEEDSQESLDERHEASIASELSGSKGIEHRLCDPNREQRRALDYKDGQQLELEIFMTDDENLSNDEIHLKGRAIELGHYFPIRERFWFDRLEGCRDHDAVFICGNAHIEGFTALLDQEGVRYNIVERGIGVTNEEHVDWARIVEYLSVHPELREG